MFRLSVRASQQFKPYNNIWRHNILNHLLIKGSVDFTINFSKREKCTGKLSDKVERKVLMWLGLV